MVHLLLSRCLPVLWYLSECVCMYVCVSINVLLWVWVRFVLVMQLHWISCYASLPHTLLMTNSAPFASLGEQIVNTCTFNWRNEKIFFFQTWNYVIVHTWLSFKQLSLLIASYDFICVIKKLLTTIWSLQMSHYV